MARRIASYPLNLDLPRGEACKAAAETLLADVEGFHDYAVNEYGGSPGISAEGQGLLISAVFRPFTLIESQFAFSTGLEQAAALLQSLIQNHPFVDGNKRTALMTCAFFLQQCGYWQDAIFLSQHEFFALESLILEIANEHTDLGSGQRTTGYSISEIARRLDQILASSQNRRVHPERLISGAFHLLGEWLTGRE